MLTRAAYSNGYFKDYREQNQIDFIFALQGAYRIDRHFDERSRSNSINIKLLTGSEPTKRFVATTSKNDKVIKLAKLIFLGTYIGNNNSKLKLKDHKSNPFHINRIDENGNLIQDSKKMIMNF